MKKTIFLSLLFIFCLPFISQAGTLQFSAWVPYWKKTVASAEATANLDKLTAILPFSYEVNNKGVIWDPMKINQEPWTILLASARAKKIKILTSIAWTDKTAIQKTLSTQKSRLAHIEQISDLVKANNFDGIDIDYENKSAKVFHTFAAFIRDLSKELKKNKKTLSCTLEPRLPPTSRFTTIPEEIKYANDYKLLNQYCDEVRLMTYDQMTADLLLNKRKKSLGLYAPVADADFVKKVVAYARQQISAKKIIVGVANYGYAWQVIDRGSYYEYKKLSALTYKNFMDLAGRTNSTPSRNAAGELSFSYQKDGQNRYAVLSDSVAIASKISLARKMGVKGVTLFKIDGESDPALWSVMK